MNGARLSRPLCPDCSGLETSPYRAVPMCGLTQVYFRCDACDHHWIEYQRDPEIPRAPFPKRAVQQERRWRVELAAALAGTGWVIVAAGCAFDAATCVASLIDRRTGARTHIRVSSQDFAAPDSRIAEIRRQLAAMRSRPYAH